MSLYFVYPVKNMKITQSYTGTTSHLPHTTGNPKDYPIDDGGKDTGKDPIYATCDMVVKRLYTKGTNTIWLTTRKKVKIANGKKDYVVMMLTHSDDVDFKKLYVGKVINEGEIICYEGRDGATANHIHISVGLGAIKGNGWEQNSKGKWVLSTTKGTLKPEDCFFIDSEFNNVIKTNGIKFKEKPYETGTYEVVSNTLNVRVGAGLEYDKVEYKDFTSSAKKQIKNLKGKDYKKNHFVKGMNLSITNVKDNWGKCPTGWVNLDYCKTKVRWNKI